MAGSFEVHVQVSVAGPLTDSRGEDALAEWAANTAKALADEGRDMLAAFPMNKTGRATGGFRENLHVLQQGPVARVPGPMIPGVVWSPWLEGTSQRNRSTRFKGYHLFRKTRAQLQQRAPAVGEEQLAAIMPRLGGS